MFEATEFGEPMATESLGDMSWQSGLPIESYRWYRIAECYGNAPGSKVERARQRLTSAQIALEDQNAILFVKNHPKLHTGENTCRWQLQSGY